MADEEAVLAQFDQQMAVVHHAWDELRAAFRTVRDEKGELHAVIHAVTRLREDSNFDDLAMLVVCTLTFEEEPPWRTT